MINTLMNNVTKHLRPFRRRLNTVLESDVVFTISIGFLCGFWTMLFLGKGAFLFTGSFGLFGWLAVVAYAYASFVALVALIYTAYRKLTPRLRHFWHVWRLSRDEALCAEDETDAPSLSEVVGEETCYLTVSDARGHVQTLAPGESGYEEAACVVMTLYPHLTSLFRKADDSSSEHAAFSEVIAEYTTDAIPTEQDGRDTCYLAVPDEEQGIRLLAPGEPGYLEAALAVVAHLPRLNMVVFVPDDLSSEHPDESNENDPSEEVNS